jgi:hypothetical protein
VKLLCGIGAALFSVFFLSLPSGAQELPAPVPFVVNEGAPAFGPTGPLSAADMSLVVDGGFALGYIQVYSSASIVEQCATITRQVIANDGAVTTTGCPGDDQEGPDIPYGFACASPCTVRFSSTVTTFALAALRIPTEYGGVDFTGVVQDLVATSPTTTTTVPTTTTTVPPVQSVQLEGIGSEGLAWIARFLLFGLGMVIGR